VLPPFNGGLHCGARTAAIDALTVYGCSRLSTAGSIAAGWPGKRGARSPAPCSRLSTAGSIAAARSRTSCRSAFRCSRLSTAGSIAARTPPRSACPALWGAPAFQRRAPLRPGCFLVAVATRPVLPPFNGGLHCGMCPTFTPVWTWTGCSRLSTAGSIAAHLHRQRRERVPGAPAFQRRAPLRPAQPSLPRCSRPRAPAFQRRAPLRPGSLAVRPPRHASCSRLSTAGSIAASAPAGKAATRPPVLPPFNGGLHCGILAALRSLAAAQGAPAFQRRAPLRRVTGRVQDLGPGGAPAFQRRAPLRQQVQVSVGGPLERAPAFQRRAPLRPSGDDLQLRDAVQVLPPFNGGLHCGRLAVRDAITGTRGCSRLSTAGSIAAAITRARPPASQKVLPPFNGGLHCGYIDGTEYTMPAKCSRLSTAGSVAVCGSSRETCAVLPPFKAGSIAVRSCTPAPRWRPRRAPAFQRRAPLRHGP